MATEVIVLNGGSSSGKSSIAWCMQELLDEPWATLGVDRLLDALAPSLVGDAPARSGRAPLIRYSANGIVHADASWKSVESAWYQGMASMARGGLGVIIDDVLLGGAASQQRLAKALDGLIVLWVGVRCDPAVAAAREATRPDRIAGMAVSQASAVHKGISYDVAVDTTATSIEQCARAVLARMRQRPARSLPAPGRIELRSWPSPSVGHGLRSRAARTRICASRAFPRAPANVFGRLSAAA